MCFTDSDYTIEGAAKRREKSMSRNQDMISEHVDVALGDSLGLGTYARKELGERHISPQLDLSFGSKLKTRIET